MKQTSSRGLWTRNFSLVTIATTLGAAGGIASGFALSFLVYDETGSTFAAALLLAIQIVPSFLLPLVAAPIMDRLPRKPFLVFGDLINGVLYLLAALYLKRFAFSYIGYLMFSLVLSSLGSFDRLAYDSIYPKLIPEGQMERGYAVSAIIYPVMQVVMMPLAAVLYDSIGVSNILLVQSGLSILAGLIETGIRITEERRMNGERFSFSLWLADIKEAAAYLKREKGLQNIFAYMSVTNGFGGAYAPILTAFFRTAPGFTLTMYSFFTAAEFTGRTLGGMVAYRIRIPVKRRFGFAFFVYQIYETMDMLLLWLPYPLMLVNRALAGFLGINSATMRQAAVQSYLPEELRARINAFEGMLYAAVYSVLSLAVGALGEILDYRLCLTVCAACAAAVCWLTVFRGKRHVSAVYNRLPEEDHEPANEA